MKVSSLSVIVFSMCLLCGCSYTLRKDGLKDFRLGDPFLAAEQISWSSGNTRDTLFTESGYEWRGVILSDAEGSILIEEDFFNEIRINRIRVETPLYQTRFKARVGEEVRVLTEVKGPWIITPIAGYGVLDLQSERYPSFHFLIPYQEEDPVPESLEEIDGSKKIVGIVIM